MANGSLTASLIKLVCQSVLIIKSRPAERHSRGEAPKQPNWHRGELIAAHCWCPSAQLAKRRRRLVEEKICRLCKRRLRKSELLDFLSVRTLPELSEQFPVCTFEKFFWLWAELQSNAKPSRHSLPPPSCCFNASF